MKHDNCCWSFSPCQILHDRRGVTTLEYLIAATAIILGALIAARAITVALSGYLHRIYLSVALPIL